MSGFPRNVDRTEMETEPTLAVATTALTRLRSSWQSRTEVVCALVMWFVVSHDVDRNAVS